MVNVCVFSNQNIFLVFFLQDTKIPLSNETVIFPNLPSLKKVFVAMATKSPFPVRLA